eukprot:243380_1
MQRVTPYEDLVERADATIGNRLVSETQSGWKGKNYKWIQFNQLYELDPQEVSDTKLKAFFEYRIERRQQEANCGLKSGTLRSDMYAIKEYSTTEDDALDVSKRGMPAAHRWLTANDYINPPGAGKKIFSEAHLMDFQSKLNPDEYEDVVYWAAIALLFCTIGRSARITRKKIGGAKVGMIQFESGSHVPQKQDEFLRFRF